MTISPPKNSKIKVKHHNLNKPKNTVSLQVFPELLRSNTFVVNFYKFFSNGQMIGHLNGLHYESTPVELGFVYLWKGSKNVISSLHLYLAPTTCDPINQNASVVNRALGITAKTTHNASSTIGIRYENKVLIIMGFFVFVLYS